MLKLMFYILPLFQVYHHFKPRTQTVLKAFFGDKLVCEVKQV